jgi:hypothetical protein
MCCREMLLILHGDAVTTVTRHRAGGDGACGGNAGAHCIAGTGKRDFS